MTAKRMSLQLSIPDKLPRWATGSGKILEPGETDKTNGWALSDKPPARWMNWIQNTIYEWLKVTAGSFISNWFDCEDMTDDSDSVIYHPGIGRWGAVDAVGAWYWASVDGNQWTNVHSLAAASYPRCIGIDLLRILVPIQGSAIEYSTDGNTTWATDSGPTIEIDTIETKYPSSNFCLIGGFDGSNIAAIEIASGGVTTSWVLPTTPPSPSYGPPSTVRKILWLGGSVWWCLINQIGQAAESFISLDNGDNWSATASDPSDAVSFNYAYHAAYNPDDDILIVVGGDVSGNTPLAAYSPDRGATWYACTINEPEFPVINPAECVYYCGGGIWFIGTKTNVVSCFGGFVSYDNGLNFFPATYQGRPTKDPEDIRHTGCDGRQLVSVGESGFICRTLAIPGKSV